MICVTCIHRHWIVLPSPANFTVMKCDNHNLIFGIASDVAHGKGDKGRGVDAMKIKCKDFDLYQITK